MFLFKLFFLVVVVMVNVKAKKPKVLPHEHSSIRIESYEGPLNKHVLTLFKNVEILEFDNCNITSAPAHLYSKLPHLKQLLITNTTYQDVHYDDVLQGAIGLEVLHFSYSAIDQVRPDGLRTLPNLRELKVHALRTPYPVFKNHVLNETAMEYLEFTEMGIEKLEDHAFAGLQKLKVLNLTDNKLTNISYASLSPLENLNELIIGGNRLEEFDVSNLPQLPNLKKIDLSRNPLKKLKLEGREQNLPALKIMDLQGCNSLELASDVNLANSSKFEFVQ